MKKALLLAMTLAITAMTGHAQDLNPSSKQKMPPVGQSASQSRMAAKAPASIAPTAQQMWWGYFSEADNAPSSYGYSQATTIDAYICVPAATEMVAGSTIKAIRVWFNSDIQAATSLKLWLSRSEPTDIANADYVQTVNPAAMASGANDIALDKPFDADSGAVYVGYTATTTKRAYFVMVGGTPTPNAFYYRNSNDNKTKDYSADGKLAIQLLLDGGHYPTDRALAADFGTGMVLKGESTTLPVTITNKGSNTIESISYTVTTNGTAPTAEQTVRIAPLPYNGQAKVNIGFTAEADTRKYNKEITITKVNGNANAYSWHKSQGTLITINEKPQALPVLEEFTGTWCGYCPYGIVGLEKAREALGDKVALIAVHDGDVMAVPAYSPVVGKYAEGFPSSRINREGDNIYPSSSIVTPLRSAIERTTIAAMTLAASWADEAKTLVKFDTETNFAYTDDNANYGIAFVLAEDGLKGTSSGWSQTNFLSGSSGSSEMSFWYNSPSSVSGLEFNHVAVAAWDILTGINGSVPATFSAGQALSYSYTADISPFGLIQDKEKLTAIALLIDRTNGTIVNAAQVKVGQKNNDGQGGDNQGGEGGNTGVKGDVNGDGRVDVADISTIISIMAGTYVDDGTAQRQAGGTTIYQSEEGEEFYCNGVYAYDDGTTYFMQDLDNLNRHHFAIEFDYTPEQQGYLIVLSHFYRVLSLYLNADGKIHVNTNNQRNQYTTNCTYSLGKTQHISLEYDGGTLTLNGEKLQIDMNEDSGDNELSTINFSNGKAYKGWLKNIIVTNYE